MTGAKQFAQALFSLSEERGTTEPMLAELCATQEIFQKEPAYPALLDTPALSAAARCALVDEAFAAVQADLRSFLKILCERHAVRDFPKCVRAYRALYDDSRAIVRVEAVSAVAMTEEQLDRLTVKLRQMTGKQIILHNTVDPSVLGGVRLRYAGKQIDATLRTRLNDFENALRRTIVG